MARHVAGLRAAAFLTAGMARVPFWKFILADAGAAAVSVPFVFALAYFFTDQIGAILADVHRVGALARPRRAHRADRRRGRPRDAIEPACLEGSLGARLLFVLSRKRFEDTFACQLGEDETHPAFVWLRERALDRPHRATEPVHLFGAKVEARLVVHLKPHARPAVGFDRDRHGLHWDAPPGRTPAHLTGGSLDVKTGAGLPSCRFTRSVVAHLVP